MSSFSFTHWFYFGLNAPLRPAKLSISFWLRFQGPLHSSDWSIDGDELMETITSSNMPQLMPVGYKTTDKIIEITDSKMILKDSDGEITTYYRKK